MVYFMSFYPILSKVHSGTAILLLSLAIVSVVISVLIAVKPAVDPANAGLVRKANIVGTIELIIALMVTLTGVIAVFSGSWVWSEFWVWLSMVTMVFYTGALIFLTRPARLAVADGGSAVKTGLQVILQIGHVLLLFVAYALMFLKPQ